MSEKLRPNQEDNHEQTPGYETGEHQRKAHEQSQESHKPSEEKQPSIESIAEKVEKHSTSSEKLEHKINRPEREKHDQTYQHATPELKKNARKQAMKDIRRQLSMPNRVFSKTIHQPIVDAVSEATGKTIARPTGLLTGGMFSLISSVGVLFIAKYYGYEYNFLIGIASFAGGFITGLAVEALARLLHRSKN